MNDTPPESPAPVRANVERLKRMAVHGWAVGVDDEVAEIEVYCADSPLKVQVRRVNRRDVCESLALPADRDYGFEAQLGVDAWAKVPKGEAAVLQLCVGGVFVPTPLTLDGAQLGDWLAELRGMSASDEREVLLRTALEHLAHAGGSGVLEASLAEFAEREMQDRGWTEELLRDPQWIAGWADAADVKAVIESVKDFVVRGWAVDVVRGKENIEVKSNGKVQSCEVIRIDRGDVRDALGLKRSDLGFEITLPGGIWEGSRRGQPCAIEIFVNRVRCHAEPLVFDLSTLEAAVARLEADEKDASSIGTAALRRVEQHYRGLLLLEHVASAGGVAVLSLQNAAYVARLGQQLGLTALVGALPPSIAPASDDGTGSPDESESTRFVWRLQRLFNSLVHADGSNAIEALEQTMQISGLHGDLRLRWLMTMVPFFCSRGRFTDLRVWLNLQQMQSLAGDDNLWQSSLLPFLAHEHEFTATAQLLKHLSAGSSGGWLNTECVHEAVRFLTTAYAAGKGEQREIEDVLSGLLSLLESLGGSYWSRLHDLHLVGSLVHAMRAGWIWRPEWRRRLCRAALRYFGLMPAFWAMLDQEPAIQQMPDTEDLVRGAMVFHRLRRYLNAGTPVSASDLDEVLADLDRARAWENPEVAQFARELLLSRSSVADAEAISTVFRDRLRWTGELEFLRLGATEDWRFSSGLDQRIAAACGVPQGDFGLLRCRAFEEVARLAEEVRAGDREAAARRYDRLVAILRPLHAPTEGCVGLEVQATAWLLLRPSGADLSERTTVLRQAMTAALSIREWAHPPAGLMAACALLHAEQVRAPAPTLEELLEVLTAEFGEQIQRLLQSNAEPTVLALRSSSILSATLVVVCSSHEGLRDRIPHIRDGWVAELRRLGVPVVIAVGNGDGRLRGDVLALPVPDVEEFRAQKVLALIDWVRRCTDFSYLVKIDDDCYLNARRWVQAQVHRGWHYTGSAANTTLVGDEAFWRLRSGSSPAVVLDKSPESTRYADGRGGYALSRHAMEELATASASAEGQRLAQRSYLDGKLVGDMLNRQQIDLHSGEHLVRICARLEPDSPPVNLGAALFRPGMFSPTLLERPDDPDELKSLENDRSKIQLAPSYIWPTCEQISVGPGAEANRLELLSDPYALLGLRDAQIVIVAVARNERLLLPYFLAHYRKLGVQHFVMVDNLSTDGTRAYLLAQPDVVVYGTETEYRNSHFGVAWQQAVLGNHCRGKWVLLADIDEFLVFPDCESRTLLDWVRQLGQAGADAAMVKMVDMYPRGTLADADFTRGSPFVEAPWFDADPLIQWKLGSGTYSGGSTYLSAMRHRVIAGSAPNQYTSQKIALLRYQPWVRFSEGLHYASGLHVDETQSAWFAHFKYHAGFQRKVIEEVQRKQHYNGAEEYRRYLDLVGPEAKPLFDESLSNRYASSMSFGQTIGAAASRPQVDDQQHKFQEESRLT